MLLFRFTVNLFFLFRLTVNLFFLFRLTDNLFILFRLTVNLFFLFRLTDSLFILFRFADSLFILFRFADSLFFIFRFAVNVGAQWNSLLCNKIYLLTLIRLFFFIPFLFSIVIVSFFMIFRLLFQFYILKEFTLFLFKILRPFALSRLTCDFLRFLLFLSFLSFCDSIFNKLLHILLRFLNELFLTSTVAISWFWIFIVILPQLIQCGVLKFAPASLLLHAFSNKNSRVFFLE